MDKLKELQDLETKLQADLSRLDIQIKAAKGTLGTVSVKHQLGLLSKSAVDAARDKVDSLVAKKQAAETQLAAIPAVVAELKQPDTANTRGPDRHKLVADAQETYQRLMSQLTLKAHRTTDSAVTPEVLGAMQDLYEAGVVLRNTARVADTIECWGVVVKRNVMGEMIGFADDEPHYGNWSPDPAPVDPKDAPWRPPVFASYAKRLKLSEKHLLQLYVQFQKESGNTLVGWTTQTRARFHKWQDWLEDGDYVPEPDFRPPEQEHLAKEMGISERSLRNYFTSYKQEKRLANGYLHMNSSTYQAFREYLNTAPARSGVTR